MRLCTRWKENKPLEHVEDNIYYDRQTGIFYWMSQEYIDVIARHAERLNKILAEDKSHEDEKES